MTRSAAAALVLLLASCAHTQLPDHEQVQARARWTNQHRQLKVSLYAAPFFRDDSRRLLTVQPPRETELLVTPKGKLLPPGDVEEILPAGTPVTVLAVSFPTAWESFTRPLLTPSDRPWVELALDGRRAKPAFVLVLRPDVKTEAEVAKELERWLTPDDVAAEVAALAEPDRGVVVGKRLAPGVRARSLELAFGPPSLRKVFGEGASVVEDWIWTSDTARRTARVVDGVVTKVELPEEPAATAAR